CGLAAGRKGKWRFHLVFVLNDQDVGKIHAGGFHGDDGLAWPGDRRRHVFHHQRLRRSVGFAEDGLHAGSPAVTGMHCPEMLRACSLHRKAARSAMSSGVDIRLSGDRSTNAWRIWPASTPRTSAWPWITRSMRSPATAPGAMALT